MSTYTAIIYSLLGLNHSVLLGQHIRKFNEINLRPAMGIIQDATIKHESSEVVDILLPVKFYFNPSTRLDNVKNL